MKHRVSLGGGYDAISITKPEDEHRLHVTVETYDDDLFLHVDLETALQLRNALDEQIAAWVGSGEKTT